MIYFVLFIYLFLLSVSIMDVRFGYRGRSYDPKQAEHKAVTASSDGTLAVCYPKLLCTRNCHLPEIAIYPKLLFTRNCYSAILKYVNLALNFVFSDFM